MKRLERNGYLSHFNHKINQAKKGIENIDKQYIEINQSVTPGTKVEIEDKGLVQPAYVKGHTIDDNGILRPKFNRVNADGTESKYNLFTFEPIIKRIL